MKTCSRCKKTKPSSQFGTRWGVNGRLLRSHCFPCDNEARSQQRERARAAGNRTMRNSYLIKHYGITLKQMEQLAKKQRMRCAICSKKCKLVGGLNEPDTFHVDHCHKTGKVRGLLCRQCNVGIGALGDTLEGVQRAVEYLKVTPP